MTDIETSNTLRNKCLQLFDGQAITDVVCAQEMMIADTLMRSLPGLSEKQYHDALSAIFADVRNIITERLAANRPPNS